MIALTSADEAHIRQAPLFAELDLATIHRLIGSATIAEYPQTTLLFSQGDTATHFFIVLDGHVNLFTLTESGAQSIIEIIDPGNSFAEAVMFMNGKFPLNAETSASTRLLIIPAAPFLSQLEQYPQLTTQIFAALIRWQHRLIREIAALKGRSPAQRVGLFLLAHADPGGSIVHLTLTMTELASRIGITPESLSRVMARLRPLGVVSERTGITIGDFAGLRQFCQAEK